MKGEVLAFLELFGNSWQLNDMELWLLLALLVSSFCTVIAVTTVSWLIVVCIPGA